MKNFLAIMIILLIYCNLYAKKLPITIQNESNIISKINFDKNFYQKNISNFLKINVIGIEQIDDISLKEITNCTQCELNRINLNYFSEIANCVGSFNPEKNDELVLLFILHLKLVNELKGQTTFLLVCEYNVQTKIHKVIDLIQMDNKKFNDIEILWNKENYAIFTIGLESKERKILNSYYFAKGKINEAKSNNFNDFSTSIFNRVNINKISSIYPVEQRERDKNFEKELIEIIYENGQKEKKEKILWGGDKKWVTDFNHQLINYPDIWNTNRTLPQYRRLNYVFYDTNKKNYSEFIFNDNIKINFIDFMWEDIISISKNRNQILFKYSTREQHLGIMVLKEPLF